MRAAVLRGHRDAPQVEQWQPPGSAPGEALIELRAAPITPLDLLCASGTSYFGTPELPYVPGVQGVGLVLSSSSVPSGSMAWFSTRAGMGPGDGSLRECCSVADSEIVPITFDVPPELVAALGLSAVAAWMAITWRGELHPGEQVIVLGAGGAVGQVAVQIARLRGARRVIAGCRSAGAADRARRCGAAAAGALRALRHYGRLVQLGSAAGQTAPIESSALRSRCLRVLGYTNNELTASQRADALNAVLSFASAGQLNVEFQSVPLDGISAAWDRQARGEAPVRIVVTC